MFQVERCFLAACCERFGDPAFWAEPLNAITHAGFLLAALLGLRLLRGIGGSGKRLAPATMARRASKDDFRLPIATARCDGNPAPVAYARSSARHLPGLLNPAMGGG